MTAPQLINRQWFAAVTGSVIRVSPARGLEGPTVSSKHRNLSSRLSVPGERERETTGEEVRNKRGGSREKGSVSMATKGTPLSHSSAENSGGLCVTRFH